MMSSSITQAGSFGTPCRSRRRPSAPSSSGVKGRAGSARGSCHMQRTWALIERELRRFRRSPMLIVMSMMLPLVQLIILGNAFGGNVKHLKVGIVDQDHGVPAVKLHEMCNAIAANARIFETVEYSDS